MNVPCKTCGRTDLPLHFNRECPECFNPKNPKIEDEPVTDEEREGGPWGMITAAEEAEEWHEQWAQNQEPWEELTGKTIAQMLDGASQFKRFCAPTINGKVAKPKRFKVPIPKPKGINSVLGEYTTGRYVKLEFHSVPYYLDEHQSCGEGWQRTEQETLILQRVNGQVISTEPQGFPIQSEPAYNWPPKDWQPGFAALPEGEGRWIKALFTSQCVRGHKVEANERALWYRESRQILCESCGQRAAKARYENAA